MRHKNRNTKFDMRLPLTFSKTGLNGKRTVSEKNLILDKVFVITED